MDGKQNIYNQAPDVEVIFEFNGSKDRPCADGYRPDHLVTDDYLTCGVHHYYNTAFVAPDGRAEGTITFITPEAYPHSLWVGKKINIQEGSRIVGVATVLKVFNPLLLKPTPTFDPSKLELIAHNKNYSVYFPNPREWVNIYSDGAIYSIQHGKDDKVVVRYKTGEEYAWQSKYIGVYNMMYGIGVSTDGNYIFAQTWEYGLFCLNAKTGERVWRTKSKRGVTSIFVGDNTLVCARHGHSLQLIDLHTGELIKELRPFTGDDFDALDSKHLICRVTAYKWALVEAETLEIKEFFSHKEFTANHTDYCISHIRLEEAGVIYVCGFTNAWDESVKPPKLLPNPEFENRIRSEYLSRL